MADFFEIDFLSVGTTKSGDAICLRYEHQGSLVVHVIDGGYQDDGQKVLDHLQRFYGGLVVEHVVATHPDGDHAAGLQTVLESAQVGTLWINRPWMHAAELLPRFAKYTNANNLARALKNAFPNLARLEEIANARGIPIADAYQGTRIGEFTVLAPSFPSFLDYVVEDERTPLPAARTESSMGFANVLARTIAEGVRVILAGWGIERFSASDTSPRNNMSIVQYARLSNRSILLTADVGRAGLEEAATYASMLGIVLPLPQNSLVQVPHHGSRHNVSSETLNQWLGEKDSVQTGGRYTAVVSVGKDDQDHPRKAVVRGFAHRGANVLQTKGNTICTPGGAAPGRAGWVSAPFVPYPEGNEE